MLPDSPYELIDFGDGRKLERFHPYVLDRPSPQAQRPRSQPAAWLSADARFEMNASGQRGYWSGALQQDATWIFHDGPLALELRLTPFGQLGIFPEQARIWQWVTRAVQSVAPPCRVLNLFAYTGASTLAAAAAGAEVVHLDASRTAVTWARHNAQLSGLGEAPIQWIVDDALTYVRREIRRGKKYHAIIMDPPTYGRGPRRQMWQIDADLDLLLGACRQLVAESWSCLVVTCHTTGWSPSRLERRVRKHLLLEPSVPCGSDWLQLQTRSGRILPSGMVVRWSAGNLSAAADKKTI